MTVKDNIGTNDLNIYYYKGDSESYFQGNKQNWITTIYDQDGNGYTTIKDENGNDIAL